MEGTLEETKLTTSPSKSERHSGIDLLKTVSIMMVILCHVFGFAAGMDLFPEGSAVFYGRYIITSFCIVMINCFVFSSAYFICTQKFRLSRLVKLSMVVFFWLLVVFIYLLCTKSDLNLTNELLILFLPVSTNTFWFYSAYVVLYLISPILNLAISKMTKGSHLLVCIISIIIACILTNVIGITHAFPFTDGYNVCWFIPLYFVVAYVRLHVNSDKIKIWLPILGYVIFTGCVFGHWMLLGYLVKNVEFFTQRFADSYAFNYNTFFVFLSSFCFFLIFVKINFKNITAKRIVGEIGSHTLAIYILDRAGGSFFSYEFVLGFLDAKHLVIVKCILAMLIIFSVRLSLDYLRSLLFKIFERTKGYKSFMQDVDQFPYWIINKINKNEGETL